MSTKTRTPAAPAAPVGPPTDLAVAGSGVNIDQLVMERAWRATQAFRGLLPQLEGLVRAITRNPKINVQITTGTPRTDGQTVWLRPPIKLGDSYVPHLRSVCGERDDLLQNLCAACALREEIMETLFHECAHILADSFAALTDAERTDIILRVLHERPGISGTRLAKLQARFVGMKRKKIGYMDAAQLISPYLPIIVNALEDARVNRAMYTARPGTQVWFKAAAIRIFENGIENADGSFSKWSDMGPNAQAIIGLLARASGFKIAGWFAPEIETALLDPELNQYLAQVAMARSAASVYNVAFPILERLREMNLCKRLDEPEDDPKPRPQPQPQPKGQEEEGEPGEGGSSSGIPEDEGTGGGITAPEDIEPEAGNASNEAGEPEDDIPQEQEDESGSEDLPTDPSELSPPPDPSEGSDPDSDDSEEPSGGADESDSDGDEDADENEYEGGQEESEDDKEADKGAQDHDNLDDNEPEPVDSDPEATEDAEPDPDDEPDSEDDEAAGNTPDPQPDENLDDVETALRRFGGHEPAPITFRDREEAAAINKAIVQGADFDAPSLKVLGVIVHRLDNLTARGALLGWNENGHRYDLVGTDEEDNEIYYDETRWDCPETILSKSLFVMRKVFAFNRASKREAHLRHGRVHGPDAFRAVLGDDKVFARNTVPGRRQYAVTVGLDISGSTWGTAIHPIKEAGMAMAELFSRTGVDFALYAHSGDGTSLAGGPKDLTKIRSMDYVDQFEVKRYGEPWATNQKTALRKLTSCGCNLDGHSLEFYRKLTARQTATDKLIIYFTDGEMPASNFSEELMVLRREIQTCQRLNIKLLGVGIGTDSPRAHGLDTVRIDGVEDIPRLIKEIETRLT